VESALEAGFATPDLGGTNTTQEMTDEVIQQVLRA
jgi:isocitrate/isopropylmalate dehydrogenase